MLRKIRQGLALAEIKIKVYINRLFYEEKGGTEIVAILLIIIILIGVVLIFKEELMELIEELFDRISDDVKTGL